MVFYSLLVVSTKWNVHENQYKKSSFSHQKDSLQNQKYSQTDKQTNTHTRPQAARQTDTQTDSRADSQMAKKTELPN